MINTTNQKFFNLVTNDWIPVIVITANGFEEKEVSLDFLFKNAKNIIKLACDDSQQTLAIFRLLLAITQKVYRGQNLQLSKKNFIEVTQYLTYNFDKFNFFGDNPFYQVNIDEFNSLVLDKDKIESDNPKKSGRLLIRQLNRRINESSNSINTFSPKTESTKDDTNLPELIRWLISYQQFTTSVDKVKAELGYKFSRSAGWLYKTDPTYVEGSNLFDTLILNTLEDDTEQKPFWEWNIHEYIKQIQDVPDNLSQLYTLLSRLVFIYWDFDTPIIYTAALPMPNQDKAFIEPMTTWRELKTKEVIPVVQQDNSNLIEYRLPELLKDNKIIKRLGNFSYGTIKLINCNYISDGKPTSQAIVGNYYHELNVSNFKLKEPEILIAFSNLLTKLIKSYYKLQYNLNEILPSVASKDKTHKEILFFKKDLGNFVNGWVSEKPVNWYDELADWLNSYVDTKVEPYSYSLAKRSETLEDGKPNMFKILNVFKNSSKKYIKEYREEEEQWISNYLKKNQK